MLPHPAEKLQNFFGVFLQFHIGVDSEAKQNAQVEGAEREGMKQRISEMQQFLAEQTQDITEYDEQLVRRLIEKITVYDEKVIVEFKSGTSVDIHR